ncbi:hypothetical protein YB2330_003298 [Saitoella coloradoensis]
MENFRKALTNSKRTLVLCGAGLSAASGLPTFRGAGGLWRNHVATELATPEAFDADPSLVWQFYHARRHAALRAKPNAAHIALAEYTKDHPDKIFTISQNVDGLSTRAGHPRDNLHLIHGNLFDLRCSGPGCGYVDKDHFQEPLTEGLKGAEDVNAVYKDIRIRDLPMCPKCKGNLLRPGVVWFGEGLPMDVMDKVDKAFLGPPRVDLMLVVGTSGVVWPAAGFAERVRRLGGKVAIFNIEVDQAEPGDWVFEGPCEETIPEALRLDGLPGYGRFMSQS